MTWPPVARWPYLTVKWLLIALGVYLMAGLAFQRAGLGLGVAVAVGLAIVKGLIIAFHRSDSPASPRSR